jgi:hypothetical protein
MAGRVKVPKLSNPAIQIRLADDEQEIAAANEIIYASYVNKGYWQQERDFLQQNRYLSSPFRDVFVVLDDGKVIGSASIIKDSQEGLPADLFQPEIMSDLRSTGDRIAEVSALAIQKSHAQSGELILFLLKFTYQYSFYYAGIDRFVAVTTPKHARFYEKICHFHRLTSTATYAYVNTDAQLLTVHLLEDRASFGEAYQPVTDMAIEENFYRFLLIDDHPCLRFPDPRRRKRPREAGWLGATDRKVTARPPLAMARNGL